MSGRNQRGGIISSVFIIPVGVVVIIAVFLLGYYVGKRQATSIASEEKLPALPEVVSQYLPEKEDFTFYKTLTERGDKTVSVDLKPKPKPNSEPHAPVPALDAKQAETGKTPAVRQEKTQQKQQAPKSNPPQQRDVFAPKTSSSKVHYTIQIGSYPERALADEDVRAMRKRGYAAFLVATEIQNKGTWYRVRMGSFSSRQAAEKLAAELKAKEGITSFITVE